MTSVFDHTDYRAYLAQWYREAKAAQPRLSYRTVATRVGFRSPSFITQILQGKSNMRMETTEGFATLIGLKGRERAYFLDLVTWNQARDERTATLARKRLERFRSFKLKLLDRNQSAFLGEWHHVAIRELLAIHPTRDAWERLGSLLEPPLPAQKVKESIDLLLSLGLAVKTARGIERMDATLSTGTSPHGPETREYFLQMLELARQALDRFPREERNLSWVTLSVSEESRLEVIDEIRSFRKKLLEIAARDPKPTRVHQLNLHFFPLTRTPAQALP
ncbi:MAG: hypothetical protein RL318_426 [Fibrobacterota bacterium]|jgi:uncharacterized protein (TIGR02147 family)